MLLFCRVHPVMSNPFLYYPAHLFVGLEVILKGRGEDVGCVLLGTRYESWHLCELDSILEECCNTHLVGCVYYAWHVASL